jgi:predicted nuclease of predicted toxin-antitoxin system
MKIKLDENLPLHLATALEDFGHDVHTTTSEGLTGHADRDIWRAAQAESRFLITQDLDFSDIRQFAPGSHAGILLVRLHSPSRQNLITRVQYVFQSESVDQWPGCFVVVSERKSRSIKLGAAAREDRREGQGRARGCEGRGGVGAEAGFQSCQNARRA